MALTKLLRVDIFFTEMRSMERRARNMKLFNEKRQVKMLIMLKLPFDMSFDDELSYKISNCGEIATRQ